MSQKLTLICRIVLSLGLLSLAGNHVAAGPLGTFPEQLRSALHDSKILHQVAVFGKDDRTTPPAKYKKLKNSIGLLFNKRSSTACTAFCVASDIIATASHCLFEINARRPPQYSQFLFARRYESIRDYSRILGGGRASAAQNVMAGSMTLSINPPIDATGDWAFVKLSRPRCRNRALVIRSMGSQELIRHAKAKRIFQLAYHRDFANWRLAFSKPCSIGRDFNNAKWETIRRDFSQSDQLILHACDTGGASSGSPIFVDGPSGPEVVGINVGTYIQSNALLNLRPGTNVVANTAVSAAAFANSLSMFRAAAILQTPEEIRQLQTELKRHSLYDSKIDGAYGPITREAIIGFEAAHRMPITGLATGFLLERARTAPALPRRAHRITVGRKVRPGSNP